MQWLMDIAGNFTRWRMGRRFCLSAAANAPAVRVWCARVNGNAMRQWLRKKYERHAGPHSVFKSFSRARLNSRRPANPGNDYLIFNLQGIRG